MLFPNVWDRRVPDKIPEPMQKAVDSLKKCKTKQECLEKAYDIVTRKYKGSRMKTYVLLYRIFTQSLDDIWNMKGYLHCNTMNYVMRVLLRKSGHFKEQDIRNKWTLVFYVSPHQYLKVRTEKGWIDTDPWSHAYGLKLGDYAHRFH
jgi:hypothetical protein